MRYLILFCVLLWPFAAQAQRVAVTVAGVPIPGDRIVIFPGDTVILEIATFTAANVQVLPNGSNVSRISQNAPCVARIDKLRDTVGLRVRHFLTERPNCITADSWLSIEAKVGSVWVFDTLYVGRPPDPPVPSQGPTNSSDFALCLGTTARTMFYTSRDTAIVLAVKSGANRFPGIWANPDSARAHPWPWQASAVLYQYTATACLPGWRAIDVTILGRWSTSDTTIATVSPTGEVLWKRHVPFSLTVLWP